MIYLAEVCKWFTFILYQHGRKLTTCLRVDPHHITQKKDVVRGVANLLCIQNNLLELASLSKTLDNLERQRGRPSGSDDTLAVC